MSFGWKHAGEIALSESKGRLDRLGLFVDIIFCFYAYRMWSNQYIKECFWALSKEERHKIGLKYKSDGVIRDIWQKDFRENRKFLYKYTSRKYELPHLRDKRNKAYAKRYNMGKGCLVEYNVELSRQHYLDGHISIGNNVLLAKNVFIDYSGQVTIGDNVQITNGVIIESHHHSLHSNCGGDEVCATQLKICEGVVIGSRAIILSSCHYIGVHARIGAGAVVTKNVPDYALVVGIPAKVVRYLNENDQVSGN